jgi:3-isopropylmalate dehydrogenase
MKIAVLPGDGIGVDVTAEAVKVLERVGRIRGLPIELKFYPWGADHYLKTGETVPPGGFEELSGHDAIFMGAFGDPRVPDMKHAADILLGARFRLDLYVNFRPVRCLDDRLCPLKGFAARDIDFVVFRENTEGSYVGAGGHLKKGTSDEVAVQEDVSTRKGVERILRAAFEWAKANGRKRVVMSDKSNAMRFVGDLWQRAFAEVAQEYPGIEASTSSSPTTCSGTSPRTSAPPFREGSAWPLPATSIPERPRCSSPFTARLPSTPEPARPIRSARS